MGRLRKLSIAIILCLVSVFTLSLASCTPEAYHTTDLVNQDRAKYGLAPLEFNTMLYMKAQAWADHLAQQGYLSHSRLLDNNWSTTWTILGENVGYTYGSLEDLQRAFMNSTLHRNNILGPFNKVGTAVAFDGLRYWVVQEFMWESYTG